MISGGAECIQESRFDTFRAECSENHLALHTIVKTALGKVQIVEDGYRRETQQE